MGSKRKQLRDAKSILVGLMTQGVCSVKEMRQAMLVLVQSCSFENGLKALADNLLRTALTSLRNEKKAFSVGGSWVLSDNATELDRCQNVKLREKNILPRVENLLEDLQNLPKQEQKQVISVIQELVSQYD